MPPASKEYRDIESGRNNGRAKTSRGSHAYYQNSIVRHENETRPNTDDALLGSRPNRTRSNKNPTNPMKRLLRIPFGNSSKKSTRNSEETAIVPYDQDLKTGGTFETSSATETTNASYEPYEHPRSQKRMMEKWGKLRDEMSSNSPDSWVKSLEFAQQMAYGKDGGDSFNRDKLVKEAQDKIRNMMDFSIWHCLFAIALYVAVSVLCFSYWLETWSIVDSAYFSIVTFTTIGYGDLFPDTPRARLFTCFWALSGVACLGIALGVLGTQLIAVAESEKKKATHKQQKEVIGMFNPDDVPLEHRRGDEDTTTSQWSDLGYRGAEDYLLSQDDQDEEEPSRCRSCMSSPKTRRFVLLFTVLVVILFLMCAAEGWTVRSTIYYGLITASTVGYGDLAPVTQSGRILAILYIPMAVGLMGTLLDVVANSIIDRHQKQAQEYLKNKELTLQDLVAMDENGDGEVTRIEFLEFMLVAMDVVDQELLDDLRDHFKRLDIDGSGALDKKDLINMAHTNIQKQQSMRMMRQ